MSRLFDNRCSEESFFVGWKPCSINAYRYSKEKSPWKLSESRASKRLWPRNNLLKLPLPENAAAGIRFSRLPLKCLEKAFCNRVLEYSWGIGPSQCFWVLIEIRTKVGRETYKSLRFGRDENVSAEISLMEQLARTLNKGFWPDEKCVMVILNVYK